MAPAKCPECGSTDIDYQESGGDAVCVVCGTVCEENTMVATIEFSESGGSSSVVGSFVNAQGTKPYSGGSFGGGGRPGGGFLRSSRENTLAIGKRKIQQVASSLKLGTHYVDGAHRLFSMATQRNFTQGRKTLHVVCACLYVMCRREKSAHMLIDFSDVLQVNVYALGATFLKFRRLLSLELPIIDPSLYIHRFAARLELGADAGAVATTALRVVQRMKRDWIETGRRPAGVCAAALLVGARAHGFHRTQEDVVKALRVCGMTVSARLADFQRTPAAQMSLAEFNEHSDVFKSEENPPSFQRAADQRERERCDQQLGEIAADAAEERATLGWAPVELGAIVLAGGTALALQVAPKVRHHRTGKRQHELNEARDKLYDEIRDMLEHDGAENEANAPPVPVARISDTAHRDGSAETGAAPAAVVKVKKRSKFDDEVDGAEDEDDGADLEEEDDEVEDLFDDIQDSEIDGFILSDEEVKKKSAIWTEMNKDYLEQKDERDKLAAARAEAYGEDDETKQKPGRKKKKKKNQVALTAQEAMLEIAEKKRFSKKINYEAIDGIFGDESSAARGAEEVEEEYSGRRRKREVVGGAASERRNDAAQSEKRARLASEARPDNTSRRDRAAPPNDTTEEVTDVYTAAKKPTADATPVEATEEVAYEEDYDEGGGEDYFAEDDYGGEEYG